MEIHLSNYFNIEKGHKNLDFADINLERDTKLFIDPYLIKFGSSDICKEMAEATNEGKALRNGGNDEAVADEEVAAEVAVEAASEEAAAVAEEA